VRSIRERRFGLVAAPMRAMVTERAQYFATKWPGRATAWEVLQEAHSDAGFAQTGYNASAKAAFRERLQKAYGSIAALNQRWGSQYASFDEIQPPAPDAPLPSALNYEFQRFRQEGYREWITAYRDALKAELPDVPLVNRIVDLIPYPVPVGGPHPVRQAVARRFGRPTPALRDLPGGDAAGPADRVDQGRRQAGGDLHNAAEDRVPLRMPFQRATEVETGVALPFTARGGVATVPLALAPGEGVVIELRE